MRALVLNAMGLIAMAAAAPAMARMDLSGIKVVQPAPELPGDRAMSCGQIAAEMGQIMNKRDMKRGIASTKAKICASTEVLNRQGEERKKLAAAQQPALAAASVVGGPVANTVVRKTQAEDAALEARQQPERNRALAGLGSGMGDMMGVMNDPRLMRLAMLAQTKQCGESMAQQQPAEPEVQPDSCATTTAAGVPAAAAPAGAADPFVQRGSQPAKPAAQDPFAKR